MSGPVLTRCALQADPPDASLLPQDDIVGVTVLLLTCSYQGQVCWLFVSPCLLSPAWPLLHCSRKGHVCLSTCPLSGALS